MKRSIRPFLTAGVAVAGASLIAVAPVPPPLPPPHQRAVTLAANSVGLSDTTLDQLIIGVGFGDLTMSQLAR